MNKHQTRTSPRPKQQCPMIRRSTLLCRAMSLIAVLLCFLCAISAFAAEPVALRMETLIVPPSTQPLVFVLVKNLQETEYKGEVSLKVPDTWRLTPSSRPVELKPNETKRVPFAIEKGRNVEANRYACEMTAASGSSSVVHKQEIFAASAPYFKPTIDAATDDWGDAIPITFTKDGKKTVVATYWNRRRFSLLVTVHEEKLVPYSPGTTDPFDAIQFAILPIEPFEELPLGVAGRFEFLLAATCEAGKCFQLAAMDTKLDETKKTRGLEPLAYEDADIAVRRADGVTYYECSLPFKPMRDDIRPSEGREFFMSVLIHDPDGTGIRDLGAAAVLWPTDEDANAWSRWQGACWGDKPVLGNKIRSGFCTSKY